MLPYNTMSISPQSNVSDHKSISSIIRLYQSYHINYARYKHGPEDIMKNMDTNPILHRTIYEYI